MKHWGTLFITLAAAGVSLLLCDMNVSYADTLSTEQVQQLTNDGALAADQERQIQDIDRQLQQGNVTPQQRTDLQNQKADLERRIEVKRQAARQFGGAEGERVFDRARDARRKQYELQDAQRQLANAPDSEKRRIERRINRIPLELGDLQRGIGTLPPMPSATSAPAGSSGTGAMNLPADGNANVGFAMGGQTVKIKGTATLGSGQQIARIKANLSTLVTGTFRQPILSAAGFGAFSGQNGFWGDGDEQPPPVSQVGNDGSFSMEISPQFLQGYTDNITAQFDYSRFEKDDLSLKASYQLAVGYAFDAGTVLLGYGAFQGLGDSVSADVSINDNPSKIFGLRDGVSPWQIAEDVGHTGLDIGGWTHQALPFGTTLGWQPTGDPGVLARFVNQFGDKIDYVENNAGNSGVPVSSWQPAEWIEKPALPMPTVKVELNR